jgi:poly-gamma-glutamate synthesis protein (capsule biosynthesis protein)
MEGWKTASGKAWRRDKKQAAHRQMMLMQTKRPRADQASRADVLWLREALNSEGKSFGTRVEVARGHTLTQ